MKTKSKTLLAAVMAAAVLLTAGCGSSDGGSSAATSAAATTTTTKAADSAAAETTAAATTTSAAEETTAATKPRETYIPEVKLDEIYNTSLEPNVSDDITFEINFNYFEDETYIYWVDESTIRNYATKYTFNLDGNPKYEDVINELPYKLIPETDKNKIYDIETNGNIADFKYIGTPHILKEQNIESNAIGDWAARFQFELVDNGKILTEPDDISANTYIKAIGGMTSGSELNNERLNCLLSFTIKTPDGNSVEIMQGKDFGTAKNELIKLLNVEWEKINLGNINSGSHNNVFAIKNNKYTLVVMERDNRTINWCALINNSL